MRILFTKTADIQFKDWQKSDNKTVRKINSLIQDIVNFGCLEGRGKPEQLRYYEKPTFSRRISYSDRLVYEYEESCDKGKTFLILFCKGHYEDIS